MANSYNELLGLGSHSPDARTLNYWAGQDDVASTSVVDELGTNSGTLQGGDNTSDISTTGPNSYLTKALDLDGAADYVLVGDSPNYDFGSGDFCLSAWINPGKVTNRQMILAKDAIGNRQFTFEINGNNNLSTRGSIRIAYFVSGSSVIPFVVGDSPQDSIIASSWQHVVVQRVGSSFEIYINTVSQSLSTLGTHGAMDARSSGLELGRREYSSAHDYFDGSMCGLAVLDGSLTSSEVGELYSGPEPVVTSGSDTVSGTEQVGSTLSASGATWGLDSPFASGSNGTITYAYQWTRSDDGSGTNEADISGATSSTYTLQAADAGKYIRRRVRASNDGGFDAAADTNSNFTAQVASGFNAAWARRNTQLIGGGCL